MIISQISAKVFCEEKWNKINEHESETLFILSIIVKSIITEMTHKDPRHVFKSKWNHFPITARMSWNGKWEKNTARSLLAKRQRSNWFSLSNQLGFIQFSSTHFSLNCFVSLHHRRVSLDRVVMSRPSNDLFYSEIYLESSC